MPDPFLRLLAKLRAAEPVEIVIFGDSISELDRLPRWFGGASCRERHYGEVACRLLAERWPGARPTARYFGRGGHNTYMGLGRLHELLDLPADLTVVAFGANDLFWRPLQPEQSAFALRCILEELKAPAERAALVLAASSGDPELPRWQGIGALVEVQQGACAELGVPFVNLHQELLWRKIAGDTWERYFPSADNCHPHDAGQALWAELLVGALDEQFARQPR